MKPFALNVPNEAFKERQKSVFDQLNNIENNLESTEDNNEMDISESSKSRIPRREMKPYKGKDSIFKKPQEPPLTKSFIKRMPDFKKNPHKWIKYSLDDVKEEDMSDKSNTRAAYSFLNQLKSKKEKEEDEGINKKIKFITRTPKSNCSFIEDKDEKPSFRSSKVVMPEYVVGQKVKKERKNKELKMEKGKELKLGHLYEEDE